MSAAPDRNRRRFILHSQVNGQSIRESLGADDYSYYFVRKAFALALARLGDVVVVVDPAREVDAIFDAAVADGEACVFLSFAPPNKTPLGLRCPTIPVLAWEFGTVPNEIWDEDVRNDWRSVFCMCPGAIALSTFAASAVRRAMGAHYPVTAIPAPIFETFAMPRRSAAPGASATTIRIAGTILDTDLVPAYRRGAVWPPEPIPLLTPGPIALRGLPLSPDAEAALLAASVPDEPEPVVLEIVVVEPEPELLPEPEPEPEAEPEPKLEQVSELHPEPEPPIIQPGLRRRLQIAKHVALEWYRRSVRPILPSPLRWLLGLAGRGSYRLYHVVFVAVPPPAPLLTYQPAMPIPEPVAFALPEPEPVAALPAPEPDPEPMPEPTPEAVALPPAPVAPGRVEIVPLFRRKPVEAVRLEGVVYVAMFSPRDGRKNWQDILSAFCWSLRDRPDATLVLKLVSQGPDPAITDPMLSFEQNMRDRILESAPFKCRIVVMDGYLEAPDFRALIEAASFVVNASHCEGLCLPVMEFMSGGVPAIAPAHTAFADYITSNNAFVVDSTVEYNVWPADRREMLRTWRYRIDWNGLMLAFGESYQVAKQDADRYAAMSASAAETMRTRCGIEPVVTALREVLDGLDRQQAALPETVA